eukprot:Awhi_evm1s6676
MSPTTLDKLSDFKKLDGSDCTLFLFSTMEVKGNDAVAVAVVVGIAASMLKDGIKDNVVVVVVPGVLFVVIIAVTVDVVDVDAEADDDVD